MSLTTPTRTVQFDEIGPWTDTRPTRSTQVREHANSVRHQNVANARRLMLSRLGDPQLSLDDIARTLFISRRHLQRAFAEEGSRGYRYELMAMRVRAGAALIKRNPDRQIEEIAHQVGYLDASQFSKSFRLIFKTSPRQWRHSCRDHRALPVAA